MTRVARDPQRQSRRAMASFVAALVTVMPGVSAAQEPTAASVVAHALETGDGRAAATAFEVPGLLWEYVVLDHLHLRFRTQHTTPDAAHDVVTARDSKTGRLQDVWFHPAVPTAPARAETDRVVRAIVTSGDGTSPETAFVVGGRIGAEYEILRYMGIRSDLQALLRVRGCSFDRLSGRDVDTGEAREVYFKLGSDLLDDGGACVLQPTP